VNKCDTHPEHDSLASCTVCGKSVCKECRVKLVKKDYCQDCADDIVKNGAIVTLRKLYDLLQEKRKHQRVHVLLPVAFAAADERAKVFKGIIHNISSGGLGIIADAPFSINEPVVLDFKLPNGTRLEWRQGGVVRCEMISDKHDIGVIFMNMQEKQQLVDDFILDIKKKNYSDHSGLDKSSFLV